MNSLASVLLAIPSPSSNALEIGPLMFRFYGLMIALGVLVGVEVSRRGLVVKGGGPDDVYEIAKWAVPAGLVGARIYHVATDWKSYQGRWADTLKIWEGGLGIPGGLLLGVVVGVAIVKRKGWSTSKVLDAVIPGIPISQAIGRFGNWFNQEIFGPPTELPWALEIASENRPARYATFETFHPTFLYESLWNLALALSLIFLDRSNKLKQGQVLPLWIAGYGIGRFLIESIRTDEASIVLGLRVNIWVSGIAVVAGLLGFLWVGRKEPADTTDVDSGLDEKDELDEPDKLETTPNDAEPEPTGSSAD